MAWVMVLLPIGLLVLGFPVFIILMTTSAVVLFLFMDVPLTIAHLKMFGSVDKLSFLAAPFFIFAGELMSRGGLSNRIVTWVLSLSGGMRGSLPITAVGSCAFFGAMSGSGAATTAAVGQVLYKPLLNNGYSESFSAGVLASSGAIAVIIPPSIAMILYGGSAEVSVVKLFIAGFIPGIMLAALMALYIYIYARINNLGETQSFSLANFISASRRGFLALATPLIILGGIYSGIFDPTEAGAVAGIYAIVVTMFAYGDLDLRGLWEAAVRTAYVCAQIFIIIAAAGLYSWLLTISGVPQAIAAFIQDIGAQPWAVLLVINLLLLVVGCLLDPTSAIIILTPLLIPIVQAADVDLIHFGIIMVMNLEIGMFTPPFGLNIFVVQSVLRAPLAAIYRGVMPFIIINIIALGIVTYVPDVSLVLTRLIGP